MVQWCKLCAADVPVSLVNRTFTDSTWTTKEVRKWQVITRDFTYDDRINVPEVDHLGRFEIMLFHDNPESGHYAAPKPTVSLSWEIFWPAMDWHVCRDVLTWHVCHRMKYTQHARHDITMRLENS